MKLSYLITPTIAFAFGIALSTLSWSDDGDATGWRQWRGSDQSGVAAGDAFPTKWSESDGVDWKVVIPGTGGSTPVAVGGRVYVTSGIEAKNMLLAYDFASGKLLWQTAVGADRGGKHRKGGGSNPSPVSDGELTIAYFRSGDLAAIDFDGKIVWQTNLQTEFGEDTLWWDLGTSPLLTDDAIVIAVMQSGPSYLVSLDKKTGKVNWKSDRSLGAPEEAAQSYATPLEAVVDGRHVVVVMGADHLTIHDLVTGDELGRLGGFNPGGERFFRSIASPVLSGDIVVCPYSRGATVTGVSMSALIDGKGDASIAWHRDDLGSDVPTPASQNGQVYFCSDKGVVTVIDAKSGESIWDVELPNSRHAYSSSPLVAGNHVYATREDGATFVITGLSDDKSKLIATNVVDDDEPFTVASLIAVDGSLLLRTRTTLYRIRGEGK